MSRPAVATPRRLPRFRPTWADAVVLAWYLLLTGAFLWPLIVGLDSVVPHSIRDPGFQATVLAEETSRLLHLDLVHLFTGDFYYPASLTLAMADSQIGLQVLALPMHLLGLDPLAVLNILTILSFPVTALVGDALGRYLTRSRAGGLIVGTAFAFAPYRMEHVIHLQLLQSWTIALAFLGLEMAVRERSRRGAVIWALAYVAMAATSLNYVVITALSQVVYVGTRWLLSPRQKAFAARLRPLVKPAVVAAIPMALIAIPYVILRVEGYRRTQLATFDFSARIRDYLVPSADTVLLKPLFAAFKPLSGIDERELMPGIVITALAGAGVVVELARRHWGRIRRYLPWITMAAFAVFFSLGPVLWPNRAHAPTTTDGFLKLPYAYVGTVLLLDSVRAPARFAVIVLLALAVLAAFALVGLLRRVRVRTLRPVLVAVVAVLMAAEYAVAIPVVTVPWGPTLPAVYRYLEAHPGGPVAELPALSDSDWTSASYYMLASTIDGHPRLNGWSGFRPRESAPIQIRATAASVPGWLAAAARLGAVYVVVHPESLDAATLAAVHSQRDAGVLTAIGTFGGDELYRLTAAAAP